MSTAAPLSIVIVGGGATAVLCVVALREAFEGRTVPEITVVERDPVIGLGVAYGRADAHHLLNAPAIRMSASESNPTGFVEWADAHSLAIGPADFAPRRAYGEYLVDEFRRAVAASGGAVRSVQGEAVAIEPAGGERSRVVRADGEHLDADVVILALGNPPPSDRATTIPRVIGNPWAPGALDSVRDGDRILLVGTGLTTIDIATSLARARSGIRMTATSRNLLFPRVHLTHPAPPVPGMSLPDGPIRLGEVVGLFGRHLRASVADGAPWQAVVDGMRPELNSIWTQLSVRDRQRFLERIFTKWNVNRHRMAPAVSTELNRLLVDGTLRVAHDVDEAEFDVVINCTGPRPHSEPGWNPLIDSLLTSGAVQPDALSMGLAVDDAGLAVPADGYSSGALYVVGPGRLGTLWETTAVVEIRQEATALAGRLARESTSLN